MYRSVPESVSGLHPLYLRHFLLRLSQQMGCETGGNVRISRLALAVPGNIQRASYLPVCAYPGPISAVACQPAEC